MKENHLTAEQALLELPINTWQTDEQLTSQAEALEQGKVLWLSQLGFPLLEQERPLLNEKTVEVKRKNITYYPLRNQLVGVADKQHYTTVEALMKRHYQACCQLVATLLPEYLSHLHSPMSTLRVHPVKSWQASNSWRKDDTRLHVDAFPSRPNQGERILRLFTNINPDGVSREWRVGEPFPQLAQKFFPQLSHYSALSCWLQNKLGITKTLRTRYDDLMLKLHDQMKSDPHYQQQGEQITVQFPADSSWICFSDQTPHAAMAGQYMLEQTWFLPVKAMNNPQHSPLQVLESLAGRALL
ncbi:Kdo hydroxylase family protein [Enterobacteriaceae bacterium LUAb1]